MQQVQRNSNGFRVLAREMACEISADNLSEIAGGEDCHTVTKITYANGMCDLEVSVECNL